MDVEEVVSVGDDENNKLNFVILDDMSDSDVDSLLQLKQVIASDLLSLLLSVAKVPSPSTAGIKSCTKICDDILENVIDRVSYYIHHWQVENRLNWHFDPRSFWKLNILIWSRNPLLLQNLKFSCMYHCVMYAIEVIIHKSLGCVFNIYFNFVLLLCLRLLFGVFP